MMPVPFLRVRLLDHDLPLLGPPHDAIVFGASMLRVKIRLRAFGALRVQKWCNVGGALQSNSQRLNAVINMLEEIRIAEES